MSDDQIHRAIENYAFCSLVHACANTLRSAMELREAIAQLNKARAAMIATLKESQNV